MNAKELALDTIHRARANSFDAAEFFTFTALLVEAGIKAAPEHARVKVSEKFIDLIRVAAGA